MTTYSNNKLLGAIRGTHLSGVVGIVYKGDESSNRGLVYGFAAGEGGWVLYTFQPFPAGTRNEGWISVEVRSYEGVPMDSPALVVEHVRGCRPKCKYMVRGAGNLQGFSKIQLLVGRITDVFYCRQKTLSMRFT